MAVKSLTAPVPEPRDELTLSVVVGTNRIHGFGQRVITLAILAAVVVALVLAVPSFGAVRHHMAATNPWWVLAAVALQIASCAPFVPLFGVFDRLPGPYVRRVALIEEGSGALLPGGGVTSYALGGVLLHRAGSRPFAGSSPGATSASATHAHNPPI
jgi:hypothetical protein